MIKKIPAKIELLTQLSHFGDEKTGSTPILRTMTIFTQGRHIRIPYVSGNAIRGLMRRLVMRDFFECLSIEPSLKLYHVFFSGGILEKGTESDLDLALKRRIRDTIPPLALFGAAFSNQMIPSSLVVEHAIPVAKETRHFLEYAGDLIEKDIPNANYSIRTFTDIEFFTRRDEIGDRGDDEDAVQMKVEYEVLIPGTVLAHGFVLRHASQLEEACFSHAVDLFKAWGCLGGKSGSGLGKIIFIADTKSIVDSEAYKEHIHSNKEKIRLILFEMEEILQK